MRTRITSSVHARRIVQIAIDACLVALAYLLAFTLRFEGDIPQLYWSLGLQGLPLVCVLYAVGFWMFGIQRRGAA